MAAFEITGGIDPLLAVTLEKGEAILAESNAMVAMDTALSLKGKTRGGLMGSIARKFMNDETFFQQRIEADDQAGTVLLAPNLPGDVRILDVGPAQYLLSDGAFLACTEGVELSTKSQGIGRALLGDSGGFFVMGTEGSGRIAVSGFGSIRELDVTPERPITVDNGHLVAFLDAELFGVLRVHVDRALGFELKQVGLVATGLRVRDVRAPRAVEELERIFGRGLGRLDVDGQAGEAVLGLKARVELDLARRRPEAGLAVEAQKRLLVLAGRLRREELHGLQVRKHALLLFIRDAPVL